jgi:hypothetical protein
MNIVLLVVAIFVALPLLIALFIPKSYEISSSIVIDRPKHEVFDYIKFLKNQDKYSKWVQADPNMRREFSGTDGTIGFVYAWNGNKQAGEGEQEITAITDGERINTELRFKRPMSNTAHTYMITEAITEHSAKVTWGMTGKSKYPANLITAMLKGTLKKDMDFSLGQLKTVLESQ